MKKNVIIIIFVLLSNTMFPQTKHEFVRTDHPIVTPSNSTLDYFPLDRNNYWEFIESGYFKEGIQKASFVKEIQKDTVLSTGYTYSKLISYFYSNSITDTTETEYYRKDTSGNIYIYLDNNDKLIYDFHKGINEVYPAPWDSFKWKVAAKYYFQYMDKTIPAIDLQLLNNINSVVYKETLIEGFGIVDSYGDKPLTPFRSKRTIWGSIIKDTIYGDLLAKRQNIDWNEYYPLQVGDFWKYSESLASGMTYNLVVEILSDTLLSDGKYYKKIRTTQNGPNPHPSYRWQRIDSLGNVFEWLGGTRGPQFKYHFSACVADTFSLPNNYGFYWDVDKIYNGPSIILENHSIAYEKSYYSKGVGLSDYSCEGGIYGSLLGCIINGVHYGDTTPLNVENETNKLISCNLSQNYPNPFNPTTTIGYQLLKNGQVKIKVYDILGNEIKVLVDENKPAGSYNVSFDASKLSSGVYIYRIVADGYTASKKMVLIK